MKIKCHIISIFFIVMIQSMSMVASSRRMKKRQIYREQVLPHTGGKIPESAFETDRLLLNRLQKEGIAIPDGILLEQRNPKVYPYPHNDLRPVFKVPLTPDGRYTPDEGQILYNTPPTSETTYPVPRITQDILLPGLSPHSLHFPQITTPIHATVYEPFYRAFSLPNPLHGVSSNAYNDINTNAVQPNHQYSQQPIKNFQLPYYTAQAHQIHPSTSSTSLNHFAFDHAVASKVRPQSLHSTVNYYEQEYLTSQIMNDISRYLDNVGIPFGIPLD